MTKSPTDIPILDDDAISESKTKAAIRKLQDAAWNCGTDEFKEGVSETACNRRYDAMVAARAECVSAVDALCQTVRALREGITTMQREFDSYSQRVGTEKADLQSQLEQVTKERDEQRGLILISALVNFADWLESQGELTATEIERGQLVLKFLAAHSKDENYFMQAEQIMDILGKPFQETK